MGFTVNENGIEKIDILPREKNALFRKLRKIDCSFHPVGELEPDLVVFQRFSTTLSISSLFFLHYTIRRAPFKFRGRRHDRISLIGPLLGDVFFARESICFFDILILEYTNLNFGRCSLHVGHG
jgi:hypothetical protein